MEGIDSFDTLVSVYQIVKNGTDPWPHCINTADVLKCGAFKVFKLVNPDWEVNFLAFNRQVAMHYLEAAKVGR